jgi:hypothetical protein
MHQRVKNNSAYFAIFTQNNENQPAELPLERWTEKLPY